MRITPAFDLHPAQQNDPAKIDKVAYIRFASVYRDFKDVDEFLQELDKLR